MFRQKSKFKPKEANIYFLEVTFYLILVSKGYSALKMATDFVLLILLKGQAYASSP